MARRVRVMGTVCSHPGKRAPPPLLRASAWPRLAGQRQTMGSRAFVRASDASGRASPRFSSASSASSRPPIGRDHQLTEPHQPASVRPPTCNCDRRLCANLSSNQRRLYAKRISAAPAPPFLLSAQTTARASLPIPAMAQNPRLFDPGALPARFPQMLSPPQPAQPMQHPHPHAHTHTHQQQAPAQPTLSAAPDLKPNFYNPYHVKHRRRTTKEQLSLLESTFKTTPKPTSEVRKSLALTLSMTAREVQIWFQNRRAKQKNMMLRASSATSPPADGDKLSAGPEASPSVDVCSAALLSALLPAKHRATSVDHSQPPTHAPRRHSDVPVSLLQPEPAGAATALRLATAATSTMAATSPSERTPPLSAGPQHILQRAYAAPPPASSSRPVQMLPAAHAQKKQKRAGASDTDRYHTARVHQEAFDGTNKLPLKPDDMSPRSVDEQFSLLDPANLPTFMMPGASSSAAGFGGLGAGLGGAPMQPLNMPPQPSVPYGGGMGMGWPSLGYGSQQQQQQPLQGLPGQTASGGLSQGVPQTDMSLLFSGLLGLGSTGASTSGAGNPYPGLSLNTFGLSGISGGPASAPTNSAMSATDLPFGSDPTLALYQTLFLLGQRPSQQQQQPNIGRGSSSSSSRGAGMAPSHNMSPLSPPESVAMTSPGTGSSTSPSKPNTVAAAFTSPVPGSAFSPYDARVQQTQPKQQQQPNAIFMPTSAAYSQLVGASGMNDASVLATNTDIFASTSTTSPSK
ncbi:hypothetical protein IWW45_000167 [Coemansia sp. RSA 485]|nr:hypothetical protein IWW45_000167 [Coemansia sp. RSA 485]